MAKKGGPPVPPPKTPEAAARLAASKWAPGVSPNPGGAAKGKRISTWMAEIGQMSEEDEAAFRKRKDLPRFARVALSIIDRAETGGTQANGAADTLLDRTEGRVPQEHRLGAANPHSAHDLQQTAAMLARLAKAQADLESKGGAK